MGETNYLDLVVIALVCILGIKGVLNGLIKEFFGLLGIVGGIYVASRNSEMAGSLVHRYLYQFESDSMMILIGFVLAMALFWIAMLLLGQLVSKLVNLSGFSGLDRLAGFLFGAGKIFLVFSVIFYALSNIEIIRSNTQQYTENSLVYPWLIRTGEAIMQIDTKVLQDLHTASPEAQL